MSDEQVARGEETVEQAFAQDATKLYQEAHDRSVEQEQRREAAKNAEPDLDELLKEAQALELGILPVHDDLSPEEFARRRNAQERAGREGKIVAPPEPQARDENGRFQGHDAQQSVDSELAQAAAFMRLPVDDPFVAQAKDAIEFYGPHLEELIRPAIEAGAELSPGVGKLVRALPNAVDTLIALAKEPAAIHHLNNMPRSQIKAAVENLGRWVETGAVPAGAEAQSVKPAKPTPPQPVAARASSAFDLGDESMSPEEWARKRTAERRAKGFSY